MRPGTIAFQRLHRLDYWSCGKKNELWGVFWRCVDLDFADDVVILAETIETLNEALETLSEESEPLGQCVSWIKTKIQAFGHILEAAVDSLSTEGEKVDLMETFTYLGSVLHRSTSCKAVVDRWLVLALGVMNALD